MSITEERKKSIDFTQKYYQTPARFIAKKGSGIQISDAGLKGKNVGVQRATIELTTSGSTSHWNRCSIASSAPKFAIRRRCQVCIHW